MTPFPGVQTLVYHRVCSDAEYAPSEYAVRVSDFRRQMQTLVTRGYTAVTLDEFLLDIQRPRARQKKRVLITFDDGYRDNYTHAFPVLREFNLPAVIFLVASLERGTNWWDQALGVPAADLLRPEEVREMEQGGIAFGSHTLSHCSLPGLDPDAMRRELVESKERIAAITTTPVRTFSYPYSHSNVDVRRAVRDAGYECAFAVNAGPYLPTTDPWQIRRVNVTTDAHGWHLQAKLSGAERAALWAWWKARHRSGRDAHYEIRRGF